MKKINKLLILLITIILVPIKVSADSGLDANYNDGTSPVEAIMSAASSGFSFAGELLKSSPEDKDYETYHIITSIILLVIFYIFTARYIFKLDGTRGKKTKKVLTLLGISLIPTILFSLLLFLTETYLILYILLLIIYLVVFKIITKIILNKRFKNNLNKVKELNKEFTNEDFITKSFNTYKDIQIAWMNFDTKKLKELVNDKIYEDYKTKLEKLKNDDQKNIMDNIELKKNKIKDIFFEDNNAFVKCEMTVICNDYITNGEDKVVKGKKDKVNNYKYRLVFNVKNNNKYILSEKKILKQK